MTRCRLVAPQDAVVDEDAGELVADGAVHQRRGDRRVDAAAERRRRRRRSPTRARMRSASRSMKFSIVQSACAVQTRKRKFASISRAARRVHHLGVELHAEAAALAGRGRRRSASCRCAPASVQPSRQRLDASPWLIHTGDPAAAREAGEQVACVVDDLTRPARTRAARRAPTAPPPATIQHAHPVADAEHRHAERRGSPRSDSGASSW